MKTRETTGLEVAVVGYNAGLRSRFVEKLQPLGFQVCCFDCVSARNLSMLRVRCRLVIIDLDLCGDGGLDVIKALKGADAIGIVVLTRFESTDDVVRCLTSGADTCLAYPVDFRELAATLISVHRRIAGTLPRAKAATRQWQLTDHGWLLRTPDGQEVPLTTSERILLLELFNASGVAVSRDKLIHALGHDTDYYLDQRLDMLVSRLRRKVLELVAANLPLTTVRGVGYLLSPQAQESPARSERRSTHRSPGMAEYGFRA